jgi:hypothetical protein
MAAIEESNSSEAAQPRPDRVRADHRSTGSDSSDLFWNVLTLLVWLAMGVQVLAFFSIYTNPASSLNPFRPSEPTLVQALAIPTDTPSPEPTFGSSATPTLTVTSTPTPVTPTVTPTLDPTPTETATPGPSPTATIYSVYPFILRNDPVVIAGDAIPDHDTCKLWVAGQTYDLQGAPMVGITVMLGGSLGNQSLYQLSLTGTALQFGQAGYEFIVANQPVKSKGTVWVQLFDQALIPLSGRVFLDTFEDCQQNLLLINFRQVR